MKEALGALLAICTGFGYLAFNQTKTWIVISRWLLGIVAFVYFSLYCFWRGLEIGTRESHGDLKAVSGLIDLAEYGSGFLLCLFFFLLILDVLVMIKERHTEKKS